MTTHFHQTWTSGKHLVTNQAYPLYWCIVPPRTAWSAGTLNIGYQSDEVDISRAGLVDIAGFYIPNAFGLDERLDLTPRQLADKYIPLIDAQNFDVGTDINDDTRVATISETTESEGQSDNNPATDDIEGRDTGDADVQSNAVLNAPYTWHMVDWVGGLASRKFYDATTPVGTPYGKHLLVDKRVQRYQASWDLSQGMIGSMTGCGVILVMASIPELGASDSGPSDDADERISPWGTWQRMLKMLIDAQDQITTAMFELDSSTFQQEFRELVAWKRTYNVGDDTWENKNGKFWLRGSTTLTSFWDEDRKHI